MENPEQSVSVHDKYQFEVKFTYPVDTRQREMEYHVESFMFKIGRASCRERV